MKPLTVIGMGMTPKDLTAEHLEQYRHPTRYPELYLDEILRRDPMDARTNIAYGRSKSIGHQLRYITARQRMQERKE